MVSNTNDKRTVLALAALAVGVAAGLDSVHAQDDTGGVTVEVAECVKLETPDARLACYEARVDSVLKGRSEAPSVPPAAAAPAAIGVSQSTGAQPQPTAAPTTTNSAPAATSPASTDAPDEIVATVTAVRQTVPNAHVITLDNGQVWQQTEPQQYLLRPGVKVRIYATRWGPGWRLTADELRGFIRVKRVR